MMRLNKIITLTFFHLFLGCYQTVAWGQTINGKIIDDKQLPIDGCDYYFASNGFRPI